MADRAYDVIVLGVGGMGSAALFELARRGRRVLGLERFPLGHDRGSSHGRTRVIRTAYFEHPDYVPLVRRAYERWYDLEQRCGRRLLTECGCLSLGRPDGELIAGVRAAATAHAVPVEMMDADELRRRYPVFRAPDGFVGVLEREAGFLAVEDCVRAHIEEACRLGAEVRAEEPVRSWHADAGGVQVETSADRHRAARLVITAGPWAGELLARHGAALTVMRQTLFWFGTTDDAAFRRDVFPVYLAETPTGFFYGLPVVDRFGHKAAQHYGARELRHPDEVERTVTAADELPVRSFLRDWLPAADGPLRRSETCLYTLTPDRHFLIGLHPEHPHVAIAAGFSGHGFKFASAVGEVLADLAEAGRTELPVGRFGFGRFVG
jgi:sarcosine oxidase